jgi:hypothetical protein
LIIPPITSVAGRTGGNISGKTPAMALSSGLHRPTVAS